jgi:hypothetical protein
VKVFFEKPLGVFHSVKAPRGVGLLYVLVCDMSGSAPGVGPLPAKNPGSAPGNAICTLCNVLNSTIYGEKRNFPRN